VAGRVYCRAMSGNVEKKADVDGSAYYLDEKCSSRWQARSPNHSRALGEMMTSTVSEEFRRYADGLPIFVWMQQPDGSISWTNRAWTDYVALPPEVAATAEGWAQVIHPEDLAAMLETIAAGLRDTAAYEAEYRVRPVGADDGGYRWILARAAPHYDSGGRISHWVGLGTDIHASRLRCDDRAAVNAQRDYERRLTRTIQSAALPARLPAVVGLSIDALYEPANTEARAGGDWFDVFRLVDGRLVFSVGDVGGSGLQAAITMGSLRQSIRTAALINPDPTAVLDAVDRIVREMDPDLLATAFVAVFDAVHSELRYASAGHPPPLLRRRDGSVTRLVGSAPPLGSRQKTFALSPHVNVEPGMQLVMYTDGLLEFAGTAVDGDDVLSAVVRDVGAQARAAHDILDAVIGPQSPRDDVTILTVGFDEAVVQHDGRFGVWNWTFDATDAAAAAATRHEIGRILSAGGMSDVDVTSAELVFVELIGNVLRHASRTVRVALDRTGEHPVLHVLDEGSGFEHNPRLPSDLLAERGRGLYIVSHLAEELSITRRTAGGSHMRAVLAGKGQRGDVTP
jgi:anti-sigma regulatory factor (Ser/Thr protein kinase)